MDEPTIVLAHRGLHGAGRPENSIEAIRAAFELADGLETDIRVTADGVLVLCHDSVTPDGIDVATSTYAAIQAGASHPLATYDELLEAAPAGKWLCAEVKVSGVERRVADAGVRRLGERFRIGSFQAGALVAAPDHVRWLIVEEGDVIPSDLTGLRGLSAQASLYPEVLAGRSFGAVFELVAWDVVPGPDVDRLLAAGVRVFIADDPLGVRARLAR